MNWTALWTALTWAKKNWSIILIILFIGSALNYRHKIHKQASVILKQEVTMSELERELERARNIIEANNRAMMALEAENERVDKKVKQAWGKVGRIREEAKKMQIDMATLKKHNGDCDAALIEVGRMLGEIQWRN